MTLPKHRRAGIGRALRLDYAVAQAGNPPRRGTGVPAEKVQERHQAFAIAFTNWKRRVAMMRLLSRSVFFALVFCIHFSQSARARDDSQGHERFTIRTLSTSPDRVSGADILIEIAFPSSQSLQSLIVSLNGRNVSSSFRAGR